MSFQKHERYQKVLFLQKKSSKNCILKKHCKPEQNTSFSFEFENLRVQEKQEKEFFKVGGLDVETNRDRDRERPSCRD